MADETKAPVAIRVTRPFASEEAFLQTEIDTLTRTTVTLLGAQSRPTGVILRFEVTLANGAPLLRGEGRVVGFRAASQGVDAGLTLRFTRLDARSKALVDRAASMREARARAASIHPPRADTVPPPTPRDAAPPPMSNASPSRPRTSTPPPPLVSRGPAPATPTASTPPPPPARPTSILPPPPGPPVVPTPSGAASEPARAEGTGSRRPAASLHPPTTRRREELLDRLRQRASKLTPEEVATLLASRRKQPAPST